MKLKGRGAGLPLSGPVDPSTLFATDPEVVIQILNDEGVCWEATYNAASVKKNATDRFKATVK